MIALGYHTKENKIDSVPANSKKGKTMVIGNNLLKKHCREQIAFVYFVFLKEWPKFGQL